MLRAFQVYKTVATSSGKNIGVAYVTETDTWRRTQLADSVKTDFAAVAQSYKDDFRPETVKVAMKEKLHPSVQDPNNHYTVFEIDKEDKVVRTKHLYPLQ